MEIQGSTETTAEEGLKVPGTGSTKVKKREKIEKKKKSKSKKNKKRSRRGLSVLKFGCFRSEDDDYPRLHEKKSGETGGLDKESACPGEDRAPPTHLVVTVNGIVGSAENWRFAAKQLLKKYPQDLHVHCSDRNSAMLTFDGVDVMGSRLAEEVLSIVEGNPYLKKISFIGHSLGGLIARYAIAKLFGKHPARKVCKADGECIFEGRDVQFDKDGLKGKIAGLEPINFITVATPHLGSRGHKQVPLFHGFHGLEDLATRLSWVLRRTGKHLFLTDSDDGKPPLLIRMANDTKDLKFLSALRSFRRHVVYANAHFDHLVGWSTSSIRRPDELPMRRHLLRHEKYPHIFKADTAKVANVVQDGSTNAQSNGYKTGVTEDFMETMIRGLTKVSWDRFDVSFKGSKQRFWAHSTIQVKTPWLDSDGADVIQHVVDNLLL